MASEGKRVLIVCELDGYANGWRPVEMHRFLRERGHKVELANVYYLGRASTERGSRLTKLPGPRPRQLAHYAVEVASLLLTRRWAFGRRHLSYPLLRALLRLRRDHLESTLPLDGFDLVVCTHPHDAELLLAHGIARTLYDCPNPYADEMYFEGKLTERQRTKFRRRESELFENVDHLSFSWESYARYAVEHYGISGDNLLQLNWGCVPAERRAQFATPPRIAYLGSLSGVFIDLPLLGRLASLYPHIDVYGGPPPDPALRLNYKGWAPPEVLEGYQLGLITCTKDELRREGFSAKHLQYIAYGLPVLVPAWRRHLELLRGSVPYEEETFTAVVHALGERDAWQRRSDEAYEQAQRLTWERTLQPLDAALRGGSEREAEGVAEAERENGQPQ